MYNESTKKATIKYQKKNMKAVSIRLPVTKMDQFTRACAILGTNKNAVLQAAVEAAIAQAGIDTSEK